MAARMRGYVPQRQMLPSIAPSMSASVSLGFPASSAQALMIGPDWQYPQCGTSSAAHAAWTFLPVGVAPIASMVVILLPATAETGVLQEGTGWPSTCTVHAPQSAAPQPNLVPIRPRLSRMTQS